MRKIVNASLRSPPGRASIRPRRSPFSGVGVYLRENDGPTSDTGDRYRQRSLPSLAIYDSDQSGMAASSMKRALIARFWAYHSFPVTRHSCTTARGRSGEAPQLKDCIRWGLVSSSAEWSECLTPGAEQASCMAGSSRHFPQRGARSRCRYLSPASPKTREHCQLTRAPERTFSVKPPMAAVTSEQADRYIPANRRLLSQQAVAACCHTGFQCRPDRFKRFVWRRNSKHVQATNVPPVYCCDVLSTLRNLRLSLKVCDLK
ncbi:hypothetical protein sphantq_04262 [Sphingobium sp. AntQ-1]|nr:hypothetical protein sphantq_04262 [Sphingobium sp. AntQ-1]